MKVIVVANNKGGVGKTTISQILAVYFAKTGKKTLAIDLDPQCNFSRRFVAMEIDPDDPEIIRPPRHPDYDPNDPSWDSDRGSSADIYTLDNSVAYPTDFPNLEVIPGHSKDLLTIERVTMQTVASKVHNRLQEWMTGAGIHQDYDVCIVDTNPSKGPLTTSALAAATDILIPAEMEEMSVEGLYGMLSYWQTSNRKRPVSNPLNLVGILANKFDNRLPIHNFYYETLMATNPINEYLLKPKMHSWQDYKEASMQDGTHVLDMPPSNKARREMEEICDLIERRVYGS